MSGDAGAHKHDSTVTVFAEQMLSESAMSKYHSMVNQQAQAAAAIMILGPTAVRSGDDDQLSPSYQAGKSMRPTLTSYQHAMNDEIRGTQLPDKVETHAHASSEKSVSLNSSACGRRNEALRKRRAKDREEVFRCQLCSYRSKWSHGLSNHMRTHNNTTFECTHCDYSTPWKGDLKNHLRVHNGDMFACDQCDFKTYRKQGLEKHVILHTGAKPFKCPDCDYCSAQPGNLKKHMMRHSGEKPISCDLCSYKCRQTSQLKQHVQQHHAATSDSKCISGEPAGDKVTMSGRKHSRNRQYTCVLCRLSWKSRQTYTKHMHSRHSSDNHFKCGYVCHQTFPSADQCERHRATHENGRVITKDVATNTCFSDLTPSSLSTSPVLSIGQTTPTLHNLTSQVIVDKFAPANESQDAISQMNPSVLNDVNSSQSTADVSQINQSAVMSRLTAPLTQDMHSSQSYRLASSFQATSEQTLTSQSVRSLQTVDQSETVTHVNQQEMLNIVEGPMHCNGLNSSHQSWTPFTS